MSLSDIRNQARTLASRQKFAQAMTMLREPLLQHPSDLNLSLDLAQVALSAGRYDLVLRTTENALNYHPGSPHLLFLMGNGHRLLGMYSEAAACYRQVIDAKRSFPHLHYFLGISLQYSHQYDAALEAYTYAHDKSPSALTALRMGSMHHLLGRPEKAIDHYRIGLQLNPSQQQCLCNLAIAMIEAGHADQAIEVAQEHRRIYPDDTMAYANLVYACLLGGQPQEAAHWLDLNQLMFDCDLPSATDQAFYTAVSEELLSATRQANPDDELYTTRHGFLTEELNPTPNQSLFKLQGEIRQAAGDYIDQMRALSHPWTAILPDRWDIRIWGNIQHSGGHEEPHCHQRALISGVAYIQLPEVVSLGMDTSGWICMGEADDSYLNARPDWCVDIQPKVGKLLLFPSYFFHKTYPFQSDTSRISLPVDIVAV